MCKNHWAFHSSYVLGIIVETVDTARHHELIHAPSYFSFDNLSCSSQGGDWPWWKAKACVSVHVMWISFTEYSPSAKLRILNPLNARLRTAGTTSQLRQLGHLRAAQRLLSRIHSMEAPFIHSVQDIQVQVPAFIVEECQMRSGQDQMTVCYPHSIVRRWAGLHPGGLHCLQDIQWVADEREASCPILGHHYTLSPDAGRGSHTSYRQRQIRPVVVYIQSVQG